LTILTYPTNQGVYSTPVDYYWALAEPTEMVNHLLARKETFYRFINHSPLFTKVLRLWQYYYNLYYDGAQDWGDMDILMGGDQGEQALISVNHLRSVIHLLVTYTTQNRPAWDVMAINSDSRALRQTRFARGLLNYYMEERRLEQLLRKCVEMSFVLMVGYLRAIWDPSLGRELASEGNPEEAGFNRGSVYREGDVFYDLPTVFDVVHDFTLQDWSMNEWLFVRKPVNKWKLAALYPEKADRIIGYASDVRIIQDLDRVGQIYLSNDVNADFIDYWEFYHVPCPHLPYGRKFCMTGDIDLSDDDWENDLPVYRMVAADFLLTCFGYSPGFDLMGVQEGINMLFSTLTTNINNFGQQKVWLRTGNTVNLAEIDAGCTVFQSKDKPEPLNLLPPPGNIENIANLFIQQIELTSGVNSVARGQPEASLRSGDALAIIDAKTTEYVSNPVANYYNLLSQIGTATIHLLQRHADSPRVASIAGVNNRSSLKIFSKEDLAEVDLVRVVAGHPFMRSLAGREHVAAQMIQAGLVTKEEYFTVLTTGELKPLTRAIESQLDVIHDENEILIVPQFDPNQLPLGLPQELLVEWVSKNVKLPQPLIHDDHVLHVKEHTAILDTTELRTHPVIAPQVLAHMKQHMELMFTPMAQELALLLGYAPAPLPPMGMGAPAPGPKPDKRLLGAPPGGPGGGATSQSKNDAKAAAMSGSRQVATGQIS
jgi:hypothetical protein